jgi:hypothetical protein
VSIVGPPEARPADRLTVDFVVESDRAQLSEIVRRVRDDDCGRTSATSRPSTMPSPPSTRLSDTRGRRSSAFVGDSATRSSGAGRHNQAGTPRATAGDQVRR